jgi:hypothetical protein
VTSDAFIYKTVLGSCSGSVTAWSSTHCTVPGRDEGCPTGLPEALSAWDHWPRADGGAAKEKWEGRVQRERDGTSKILLHLEDAEIMDQLFFVPLSCVLKGGNNDSNSSATSSVNTNGCHTEVLLWRCTCDQNKDMIAKPMRTRGSYLVPHTYGKNKILPLLL